MRLFVILSLPLFVNSMSVSCIQGPACAVHVKATADIAVQKLYVIQLREAIEPPTLAPIILLMVKLAAHPTGSGALMVMCIWGAVQGWRRCTWASRTVPRAQAEQEIQAAWRALCAVGELAFGMME